MEPSVPRKLVFVTGGIPHMGLMSGPVHLRIIDYLKQHFEVICASYSDEDASHLPSYQQLPHRQWWWPPGRLGLHPDLRARQLARTLRLKPDDRLLVAFPFDGLALAWRLKRRIGLSYDVLVHDLHGNSLDQPEVRKGLADASSVLCVSDAIVDVMRTTNPNVHVLYPTPGQDLGLEPGFSTGPIGLAGARPRVLGNGQKSGRVGVGHRIQPRPGQRQDALVHQC